MNNRALIDLTPVAKLLIYLAALAVTRYLIPLLKEKAGQERTKRLMRYAEIAVRAAEQLYPEGGTGTEKLNYVLQYLRQYGFDLSTDELRAAVEAAVFDMYATVDAA